VPRVKNKSSLESIWSILNRKYASSPPSDHDSLALDSQTQLRSAKKNPYLDVLNPSLSSCERRKSKGDRSGKLREELEATKKVRMAYNTGENKPELLDP
jgi:hypothetical protein